MTKPNRAKALNLWSMTKTAVCLLVAFEIVTAQSAFAVLVLPRDPSRTINVSDFSGKTYLQATLETSDGINAKTLADDGTAVTIASATQVVADIKMYDSKVANEIFPYFTAKDAGFQTAASHLQGQNVSPQQIQGMLAPFLAAGLIDPTTAGRVQVVGSDLILLSSDSGTVVVVNPDSYFYNVAYQSPVLKSGRTYAVAPGRLLLDPSDNYYLTETGNYLSAANSTEANNFYSAMFQLLTACDSSGVFKLNSNGQIVLTDFLSIYTEESLRHNMVNLDPANSAWEVDLAEVTLLGAYIAVSGMVMDQGKLTAGTLTAYYNGHSIGTHEADFTKLGKLITAYMSKNHKSMIQNLNSVTPVKGTVSKAVKGDVFRRVMIYLNRTEYETGAQGNAAAITTAMTQLLTQIQTDQSAITTYVTAHQ